MYKPFSVERWAEQLVDGASVSALEAVTSWEVPNRPLRTRKPRPPHGRNPQPAARGPGRRRAGRV